MVDFARLQAIFNRIEAGKRLSKKELQILVEAARPRMCQLRGRSSSGDLWYADSAAIVTGDHGFFHQ